MKYVSERVINISELEELIRLSYHAVVAIRNELDKQEPSVAKMVYLSEQAKQNLSVLNGERPFLTTKAYRRQCGHKSLKEWELQQW